MIFFHLAASSATMLANCCGVLADGLDAQARQLVACTSGSASAWLAAVLMRATMSAGRPFGPYRPNQVFDSKPGSVSAIGGRSGASGLRLSEVTPSARRRPSRT